LDEGVEPVCVIRHAAFVGWGRWKHARKRTMRRVQLESDMFGMQDQAERTQKTRLLQLGGFVALRGWEISKRT
jgi:hypothetical protein